ncbi:MAG: YkgJ family cysteine cluster protein [Acidobacteria bacterium]|nr:YkgJ family cysteine cluster protein [Acidobacteriota bacterium]
MEICRAVETEFSRNRRLHGARIKCGPGCTDCCGQLFQITEIEAAWVSVGVSRMEEEERMRLRGRAARYLEDRKAVVARKGMQEAWGRLPPPGSRLPCPALVEGVCSIYEYRPLICRKFGMPLYNPDKPGQVFACELNFRNGEPIEDGQLVQIQSEIHWQWKQVQADYNEAGGYRDTEPITVARAIVEDFS